MVTGIDDHSRFCVSAMLVVRATARPVAHALRPIVQPVAEENLFALGRVVTSRIRRFVTEDHRRLSVKFSVGYELVPAERDEVDALRRVRVLA